MSSRIQHLAVAGLIAAGAGTFGYAAGGLAGTERELRAAERAPLPATRYVGEDGERACPKAPPPPSSEL